MSVLERYKQRSTYKESEDISLSPPQENIYQSSPIEQLPFVDGAAQADSTMPIPQFSFTDNPISPIPSEGEGLTASETLGASTALIPQDISNRQVATPVQTATRTQREPTLIRGTGKKSSGILLAPRARRKRPLTHAAVVALSFFIVLAVLAAVLPLTPQSHAKGNGGWFSAIMNWSQGKDSNSVQIASEEATATAVLKDDGKDPGGGNPLAPTPPPSNAPASTGGISPSDAGSLNRFFYGQCTYWANMRYHQLTGHWVPWLGNASAWPSQAAAYGWVVSSAPHIPSIIAFAPGVQGAGGFGHVAIAESMSGTAITTSNWNVNGAGATTTYLTNYAGPGVSFLYYPGA